MDELTEVEVGWLEEYDEYAAQHARLFGPGDEALRALVHGGDRLPARSDVECALHVLEGRPDAAAGVLPTDARAATAVLGIACACGDEATADRLLGGAAAVEYAHLLAAVRGDHARVAAVLLATGELDDYDVAAALTHAGGATRRVLQAHLDGPGWCAVM